MSVAAQPRQLPRTMGPSKRLPRVRPQVTATPRPPRRQRKPGSGAEILPADVLATHNVQGQGSPGCAPADPIPPCPLFGLAVETLILACPRIGRQLSRCAVIVPGSKSTRRMRGG